MPTLRLQGIARTKRGNSDVYVVSFNVFDHFTPPDGFDIPVTLVGSTPPEQLVPVAQKVVADWVVGMVEQTRGWRGPATS